MPPLGSLAVAVAITGLAAACAASDDDASASSGHALREERVDVTTASKLPIAEVSGLGARMLDGRPSYLAVGDAAPVLVTFDVDRGGRPTAVTNHDLASIVGDGAPQWEAVAGDGDGRVFLLSEKERTVVVLDAELTRVVHTIRVPDVDSPEGLVLLANGHLLVANEKDDAALVELAPRGVGGAAGRAAGYNGALALGGRAFPLPPGTTSDFVDVKRWSWKNGDASRLGDISDIATDGEGRLVLLGDQERDAVRIERELSPAEDRLDPKAVFRFPRSVDKPEGLVFANGVPLVASDNPTEDDDALFTLAPFR